jgi:hypothetical protein
VSNQAASEAPVGLEELEESVNAIEKQVEAAGTSLRETAKWIIGGIAVAAAGVIAGTSLSSLGTLGIGWRLMIALSAAALGFIALGYLFASALDVIVPPAPTLQDFAEGKGISYSHKRLIDRKIRPFLEPFGVKSLKDFCEYLNAPETAKTRSLSASVRLIKSTANAELRRLFFHNLKIKTFVVTPIIALAFTAFSWAANPPKSELRVVPPLDASIDVNQADIALLSRVLGSPACVEAKLHVILLGEWQSGVQEVVTVPKPSCPPVRLRLNYGRFSKTGLAMPGRD